MTAAAAVPAFPHQLMRRHEASDLMEACSALLEVRLQQRLEQAQPRPLGLATGRTMEPLYAALVQRLQAWPATKLEALRAGWLSFNLDEYIGLPGADQASYRNYMDVQLGQPLGLSPAQVRLPDGSADNPGVAAAAYGAELAGSGGAGFQLLGLGSNGHVGFNEPPCDANARCRVVDLSPATRQQNAGFFGGDPERVPVQAITLGVKEILQAEEIHLVVTGVAKAAVLQRLLNEPPSVDLPASWLQRHPQVWIWADGAALS